MDDLDLNLGDFVARVHSDLVGKFVNLASRAAGFVTKHFDSDFGGAGMTRNIHEPNTERALTSVRAGGKDTRQRPLAGRWVKPLDAADCPPDPTVEDEYEYTPCLENSWRQPTVGDGDGDLAEHEFRLHMDGSLEFKGYLIPGTWDALAYTIPGSNNGEPIYDQVKTGSFLIDVFDITAGTFQVGRIVVYGSDHPTRGGEVWIFEEAGIVGSGQTQQV